MDNVTKAFVSGLLIGLAVGSLVVAVVLAEAYTTAFDRLNVIYSVQREDDQERVEEMAKKYCGETREREQPEDLRRF